VSNIINAAAALLWLFDACQQLSHTSLRVIERLAWSLMYSRLSFLKNGGRQVIGTPSSS
jgi:hypothetical protein